MKWVVFVMPLLLVPAICFAGITASVGDVGYGYQYTWTIFNENPLNLSGEDWPGSVGGYCILAPIQTNVLSYIAPVPWRIYEGSYWTCYETTEPIIMTGWGAGLVVASPPVGMKWIYVWASDNNAIHRPGSTLTFTIIVDKTTTPGNTTNALVEDWIDGYHTIYGITIGPTTIPEPSCLLALIGGLAGIGLVRRRRE